ncbi:MAG TPA: hypothetical protein EYP78_01625 [Candidatus Omnitrophica bacterium]|nr:hypothetical protein [Candidatus Omnitrophota bacterium]
MNRESRFLARDRLGYINVFLCPHGVVHLSYMNTSIRFSPQDFSSFALLVDEAYHRLKSDLQKQNGLSGKEGCI